MPPFEVMGHYPVVIMHPARPSEARLGGVHSYLKANSDLYAHTRSRKCQIFEATLVTIVNPVFIVYACTKHNMSR